MAALSKAWIFCCSLAGIAGSNPTGGHGWLSLVSIVCCERSLRRADQSSGGVQPNVVCLSVIVKLRQ